MFADYAYVPRLCKNNTMSNAIYEASRLREIPSGRKGSGEDAQGKILRGGFCSHISHWEGARINAGLARLCDSDFASLCWKQIDHHHYHHNVHASMRQLSHYQILQLDWARDCCCACKFFRFTPQNLQVVVQELGDNWLACKFYIGYGETGFITESFLVKSLVIGFVMLEVLVSMRRR